MRDTVRVICGFGAKRRAECLTQDYEPVYKNFAKRVTVPAAKSDKPTESDGNEGAEKGIGGYSGEAASDKQVRSENTPLQENTKAGKADAVQDAAAEK